MAVLDISRCSRRRLRRISGLAGAQLKHLRLPGEIPTRTSLRSRTPLAIFPTLRRVMRGWKVVDRGGGFQPSFLPAPVQPTEVVDQMNAIIDERFGIATCPTCGEKVAVLIGGVCRDCQPEDAA